MSMCAGPEVEKTGLSRHSHGRGSVARAVPHTTALTIKAQNHPNNLISRNCEHSSWPAILSSLLSRYCEHALHNIMEHRIMRCEHRLDAQIGQSGAVAFGNDAADYDADVLRVMATQQLHDLGGNRQMRSGHTADAEDFRVVLQRSLDQLCRGLLEPRDY